MSTLIRDGQTLVYGASGTGPATVVLAHSFTREAPTRVLAVADGRHFPVDAPAAALRIRFDGDESQSSVSTKTTRSETNMSSRRMV